MRSSPRSSPRLRPGGFFVAAVTPSVANESTNSHDAAGEAVSIADATIALDVSSEWDVVREGDAFSHPQTRSADALPEDPTEPPPATVADSLRTFLSLTPQQRSAVILRDVLGYTAPEVAELTDSTVAQVKSSLHRARSAMRRQPERPPAIDATDRARLTRYTELFNSYAFDQLRELLVSESRLEVVGRETRAGSAAVGRYFTNYAATDDWWLEPGVVEGRLCALVFDRSDPTGAPRYFILVGFDGESVVDIRDVLHHGRRDLAPPFTSNAGVTSPESTYGSHRPCRRRQWMGDPVIIACWRFAMNRGRESGCYGDPSRSNRTLGCCAARAQRHLSTLQSIRLVLVELAGSGVR